MAIKKKEYQKNSIDLTGPDGNAFVILSYAKSLAKQLDLDFEPIKEEMTSGDYEHLIQVFDNHFGEVVDLIR